MLDGGGSADIMEHHRPSKVSIWSILRKLTPYVSFESDPLSNLKLTPKILRKLTPFVQLKLTPSLAS